METITIDNISNYSIVYKDNKLILTPLKKVLFEPVIYDHITKCSIMSCTISNMKITKLKFNSILSDIWNIMTEYDIIKNTSYRFKYKHELKTDKDIINFKNHLSNINMYYCNKSGIDTFREIVKMVKLNKLSMDMVIEKSNKQLIEFNI